MIIFTTLASLALPLSTALNPEWWLDGGTATAPVESLKAILARIDLLLPAIEIGRTAESPATADIQDNDCECQSNLEGDCREPRGAWGRYEYEVDDRPYLWAYDEDSRIDLPIPNPPNVDLDFDPGPGIYEDRAPTPVYHDPAEWSPEPWWKGAVRVRRHRHR